MLRLHRSVHLDNNATTGVSQRVRRAMDRVLSHQHGNPSSPYTAGRRAAEIVQDSREVVARAVGAEPEEIVFTSGATEANNQVLQALWEQAPSERRRVLTTPIEHPSILKTLEALERRGCRVDTVPVDTEGRVRLGDLEEMLAGGALVLCCMLANNEIGTVQDMSSIVALARRHGVPVLCDCAQALGKIPVDLQRLGVDYASFSAHKLHGPKGVGALYVRRDLPIAPLHHGGGQEGGFRAGTEAVHDIAGFAEACRSVPDLLARGGAIRARRDRLVAELSALRADLVVNSPLEGSLPNTLSLRFPGESNARLIAVLDLHGISVSAGSACSTGKTTASHVLAAIGLTEQQADETIRISLSDQTSDRDVRYVVRTLRDLFRDGAPSIPVLRPSHVDEAFLGREENFVLDIRFDVERKLMKGLPNSHEASVIGFSRYLHEIPKDKNVLVVCSTGFDATPVAYALRKRGNRHVAILLGGLVAWQLQHPKLHRRLAGRNAIRLTPRKAG